MIESPKAPSVFIIGAGPAGLTAAYELSKGGALVTVIEADPRQVGGISKTVEFGGYYFDVGGHRFFSKSQRVEAFWREILPNDLLIRSRSSRIFYRKKYYSYPLRPLEVFRQLGVYESFLCALSFLRSKIFPTRQPKNLAEWVSNQFGSRLFRIFFQTYTEKVWGIPCNLISLDWAVQRIKGLSVSSILLHAIFPQRRASGQVKTLIETFRYPRRGPGMLWESCAERVREMGGNILMGRMIAGLHFAAEENRWVVYARSGDGAEEKFYADHVISSAAIHDLVPLISPALGIKGLEAAENLKYREFISICLIVKGPDFFTDNWLYIHDPTVRVGRIQNFKSWSPEMLADLSMQSLGMEYFCAEGDEFWRSSNEELALLAVRELQELGIWKQHELMRAHVIRQKKAYPLYDEKYAENVKSVRMEIEQNAHNLHLVGRNGMHRYNNQDHAIMTAMLTAENILAGRKVHDPWKVNQDAEYLEETSNH